MRIETGHFKNIQGKEMLGKRPNLEEDISSYICICVRVRVCVCTCGRVFESECPRI